MASVKVRDAAGAEKGSVDLDESWFGIEPNVPVMHQVVTAQLAARRSGTQSTKTRAEVRGGGAKPWKQKGTGRARQGSIRAPQWKGGGVALGPKPRSYAQRTPKKMIRLALRSALSDRAAEGKVIVLDDWGFEAPSTRSAAALLGAIGVEGRIVVVVGAQDAVAVKSFRNLPEVHLLEPGELNAYDILVSDYVVFTRDNLPSSSDEAATKAKPSPRARQARRQGEAGGQGQAGHQGQAGRHQARRRHRVGQQGDRGRRAGRDRVLGRDRQLRCRRGQRHGQRPSQPSEAHGGGDQARRSLRAGQAGRRQDRSPVRGGPPQGREGSRDPGSPAGGGQR